ncbi:hypothetical protein E2986_11120 [Frieseomelitta varia]|uniref:palmitoyl-protein hydrolase n=2 Tax=Meliponini TaxID=83319 RepID=A0A833RFB1_9HYME|nr:hypothetical protein E2986_11120 [Frieseomelitta varia]
MTTVSPVVIAATARHTATVSRKSLQDVSFLVMPDAKLYFSTDWVIQVMAGLVQWEQLDLLTLKLFVQLRMFDLRSLEPSGPEDEEGIRRAAEMVHSLIAEEVAAGIPTKRIVLGGFSQGGALAIYSALTFPEPLAGVIALSAWLPLHQKFPAEAIGNKNTPLLQCHGDCDPIVPYRWGQLTASVLKQFMTQTEFKTYRGMMHASCDEEMRDMKKFIEKVLKP